MPPLLPYPGYSFSNWNDGDTNNPRTITVSHNATYQAIFYRNLSIDDIDNPQITVLTQGHQITILGDNASYSRLFDITGRRINASATTNNSATAITSPHCRRLVSTPSKKPIFLIKK